MSARTIRSRVVDQDPRLWALWAASRPSQLALVVLVYALGVGMASTGSPLVVHGPGPAGQSVAALGPRVALGALALLPVTVAVHYANEFADADTDALAERTPFSGGSGALAVTGLPASFLGRATAVMTAVAVALLAWAALTGALPSRATALLAAILVAGLAYSLPPVALVRRGVGEVVNAALGGVLLPVYGVAVVGRPTLTAWLAVLPFAGLVGCNLLATHWPDREADRAVGKRTLAVRWPATRIRRVYVLLAVTSLAVATVLWVDGVFPDAVALAYLVPVPLLVWGWRTLTRQRSPLPAVLAMVALAVASTAAWWWVGPLL